MIGEAQAALALLSMAGKAMSNGSPGPTAEPAQGFAASLDHEQRKLQSQADKAAAGSTTNAVSGNGAPSASAAGNAASANASPTNANAPSAAKPDGANSSASTGNTAGAKGTDEARTDGASAAGHATTTSAAPARADRATAKPAQDAATRSMARSHDSRSGAAAASAPAGTSPNKTTASVSDNQNSPLPTDAATAIAAAEEQQAGAVPTGQRGRTSRVPAQDEVSASASTDAAAGATETSTASSARRTASSHTTTSTGKTARATVATATEDTSETHGAADPRAASAAINRMLPGGKATTEASTTPTDKNVTDQSGAPRARRPAKSTASVGADDASPGPQSGLAQPLNVSSLDIRAGGGTASSKAIRTGIQADRDTGNSSSAVDTKAAVKDSSGTDTRQNAFAAIQALAAAGVSAAVSGALPKEMAQAFAGIIGERADSGTDAARAMAANLAGLGAASAPVAQDVAQVNVPTPVTDPQFQQALASQVSMLVADDIKSADIIVNPPDMGPIRIELTMSGDDAKLVFTAAHPDTRQAIEQSSEVLRHLLSERGVSLGQMDVGQGDAQRQAFAQFNHSSADGGQGAGSRTTSGNNGSGERAVSSISNTESAMRAAASRQARGLLDLFA